MAANSRAIDVQSLLHWFAAGADANPSEAVEWLGVLCRRLVASGLPIERAGLFVRPLHPNVATRAYYWRQGCDAVEVGEEDHSFIGSEEHLASPIRAMIQSRVAMRRRLEAGAALDYPVLQEFRDQGYTDYFLLPLEFLDGEVHAFSVATRAPGGFGDEAIRVLERVRPALTRVAEILGLTRKAGNILDAYLGHHAGDKVLHGRIRRGDTERINAVIWTCDLRSSTKLAEALGPGGFLALLNDYFDAVLTPVTEHGGEILSFMGDGVLAMFPVAGALDAHATSAIDATREAIERMARLNERRIAAGDVALRFGIGVHAGELLYGNVGTKSRITFTVVGTAANEVARIEALCKTLDVSPLVSEQVAHHVALPWRSLGVHALRGVGRPIELFTF
jgi:adenylate cyclase